MSYLGSSLAIFALYTDAIVASNEYGNAMKGLLKLRQQLRQAEQDYDAKVLLSVTVLANDYNSTNL